MLENRLHVVVARFTVARPSSSSSHLVHIVISSGNRDLTDLHLPSRVPLARALSLFRLLLPSACYAGYTWGNVRLENLIGLCGTFHRLHEDQKSMFSGEEWLIPDPGSSVTILYFSKTRIEPLRAPYSVTGAGWGWKQGQTTELCTWRLLPETQPLNLLCTTFDRKSTPFMLYWYPFHAPSKNTKSLWTILNAPSFHIYKTQNQEEFSGGYRGPPLAPLILDQTEAWRAEKKIF